MKRIIAAILLAVMALSLFSCAKPAFTEMDFSKISSVNATIVANTELDKKTFVDAYNKAKVTGACDEGDKHEGEPIVVVFASGKDHMTLYYVKDNKFCVTGSVVEKPYFIDAPELSEYYNSILHPTAEFVKIDADNVESAIYTAHPDKKVDVAAVVKAYNDAELNGVAKNEKGNNVILLITKDKATLEITYIEKNTFKVSGSMVDVAYIIESADLAKLYTEAIK